MNFENLQIIGAIAAVIISTTCFVVTYLRIRRERAEIARRIIQHQLNEDRKRALKAERLQERRQERREERLHVHA